MQHMTKKAFTIIEMLVVVLLVGLFASLTYANYPSNNYDHYHFLNKYLKLQSEALKTNQSRSFVEKRADYPIRFTGDGTVNQAQSIIFDNQTVIIHLGNGSITYAKKGLSSP